MSISESVLAANIQRFLTAQQAHNRYHDCRHCTVIVACGPHWHAATEQPGHMRKSIAQIGHQASLGFSEASAPIERAPSVTQSKLQRRLPRSLAVSQRRQEMTQSVRSLIVCPPDFVYGAMEKSVAVRRVATWVHPCNRRRQAADRNLVLVLA